MDERKLRLLINNGLKPCCLFILVYPRLKKRGNLMSCLEFQPGDKWNLKKKLGFPRRMSLAQSQFIQEIK